MTARRLLAALVLASAGVAAVACSGSPATVPTVSAEPTPTTENVAAPAVPAGAQPRLAADPAQIADALVPPAPPPADPAAPAAHRRAAANST